MDNTLERQVTERKKQAEEREIFAKAKAVTLYLGRCQRDVEINFDSQVSDYIYCGENVEINDIEISYAFKLMLDEFKSLGIYPKLQLESKY